MDKEKKRLLNPVRTTTAVVLCGGISHNFTPLTGSLPKAFLKVCGKTLLYHSLRNLYFSGFRDIVFLTNNDSNSKVTNELDASLSSLKTEQNDPPNVLVYGVPCTEDNPLGTTEALRYIADLFDDHFVIVPVDLVGAFDFKTFLTEHLGSQRLCTVALLSNTQPADPRGLMRDVCLGGNDPEEWSFKYRVVATLDENTKTILGMTQMVSLENGERLELYKWHLARHPRCVINRSLVDAHVYAFSPDIFKIVKSDVLANTSIRLDLVPYIIKMQETPMFTEGMKNTKNEVFMEDYDMETTWRLDEALALDERGTGTFYFVVPEERLRICRINSLDAFYSVHMEYCRENRDKVTKKVPKLKNAMLGYSTKVPDDATIKNSVLGNYVKLGKNVKITDSVLMDNCTIGDNTVVDKSLLGASVYVEDGVKLLNSIVRSGSKVPANTTIERDYIPPFIES